MSGKLAMAAARRAVLAMTIMAMMAAFFPGRVAAQEKLRVQLLWISQAQFAGLYLAQDEGFYRQAGLEVELIPGGPGVDSLESLARGRCDMALAWLSAAMVWREKGLALVNLAQLVQRSSVVLVAKGDGKIKTMADLNGQLVGFWDGLLSLAPKAMLRSRGVKVVATPQGSTVALLTSGAAAAVSAMRYNEYHALYQAGYDLDTLVVFDPQDAGLDFPEDGLYCLEKTWRDKPKTCQKFVQASLAGWRLAFERPELALTAVMKRVGAHNQASNLSHQKWMLASMRKLIEPAGGLKNMGRLDPSSFQQTGRSLLEQGFLKRPATWEGFAAPAWRTK